MARTSRSRNRSSWRGETPPGGSAAPLRGRGGRGEDRAVRPRGDGGRGRAGTALERQAILARGLGRERVPVASTRAGNIPGTHRVGFDSSADQILLVHAARSRVGFAVGALLAARWIVGRRGMYAFADVLDDLLALERKGP